MTSASYPFLDLAVLDGVRENLAAGDAVLVLSENLDVALLANAAGAQLMGFESPFDIVGENPGLGPSAIRQIRTLDLFSRPKGSANIGLRLSGGVESRLVLVSLTCTQLPGGEPALVMSWPPEEKSPSGAIQHGAIQDMADETTHFAMLDKSGAVLSSSAQFTALSLSEFDLAQLTAQALNERDRMVKRRIKSGENSIPVGIGRLRDEPALFILLAIAEITNIKTAPINTVEIADIAAPKTTPVLRDEPVAEPLSDDHIEAASVQVVEPDELQSPNEDATTPLTEQRADEASYPVRFTWKIDAEGKFSYISPEFEGAIGKNAADVIGRTFKDIATVFAFDNNGEIASLLERRDTWSGRCVLWPIEGTDLRAPVDLAALPSYDRMRNFEGFRGFGIVRLADAVIDPEGLGLVLGPVPGSGPAPIESVETDDDISGNPSNDAFSDPPNDPWYGEVPAIVITPPAQPFAPSDEKVIQLGDRRQIKDQQTADIDKAQLTPIERNAFREIADRLRNDGAIIVPAEVLETPANIAPQIELPTHDERPVQAHDADYALPMDEADAAPVSSAPDDAPILSKLPVPVLIHNGSALLYGNPAFFALTHYASLEALQSEGGLDHLLHVSASTEDAPSSSIIVTAENTEQPVNARLHSVRWKGEHALLLSLSPLPAGYAPEAPSDLAASDLAANDLEVGRLKRQISELSSVLETATDGVVFVNLDGTIRSINQSAEALFGFDPSAVNGKPFTHLLATESQRLANDYFANLGRTGIASLINDGREVIGREVRGRFIPLFMTIGKLEEDSGFCVVLRDITQWKRAEEDLKTAKRTAENASTQKSEFLARVSHEIRTPLNAIIGFSEMMSEERFGPIGNARYLDYLNDIHRSGRHVLDLVNDLLDISKIEAGQQELNFESVELNEALAEAVAIMQPQANRERVIIRSAFASELPQVVADTRSIKQIALNLLANAVRYTGAGGQVIISTSYELTGGIAIRVRDTGVGMSAQEIEIALKPYKQINTLKRERGDGTGLGLPLTKAMVEANRASFTISSKPGEGTLIEITFPSTRVLAD